MDRYFSYLPLAQESIVGALETIAEAQPIVALVCLRLVFCSRPG